MADKQTSSGGGIGFLGLLTIVFITLKLCNVINWSWWWVLAPIWIPIGVLCTIIVVCGLVIGVGTWLEQK